MAPKDSCGTMHLLAKCPQTRYPCQHRAGVMLEDTLASLLFNQQPRKTLFNCDFNLKVEFHFLKNIHSGDG